MSDIWSTGAIAIIGSLAGFGMSYWGQRINKKNDEKKQIESFLNAIKSEVSGIWSHYNEPIGNLIEELKEDEGFEFYYPIFDNYFIVYDNNTNLIGNLDKDLSKILIETYIAAKSLKDSFIFNNQLLSELNRYQDLAQETKAEHYLIKYQTYNKIWQNYGKGIKEIHFKLKNSKDVLIHNINAQLK